MYKTEKPRSWKSDVVPQTASCDANWYQISTQGERNASRVCTDILLFTKAVDKFHEVSNE